MDLKIFLDELENAGIELQDLTDDQLRMLCYSYDELFGLFDGMMGEEDGPA